MACVLIFGIPLSDDISYFFQIARTMSLTDVRQRISELIDAMGEMAPRKTMEEITDLIRANPLIFDYACSLVERKILTVEITEERA